MAVELARSGGGARRLIWGGVLSLLFLALAVRGVSWSELRQAAPHIDLPLAALAACGALVQVVARAWRWQLLLDPSPPLGPLTRVLLVGSAVNNVLPARVGDVARAFLLRREGVEPATALASIVVERLADVAVAVALLAAALTLAPLPDFVVDAGLLSLAFAGVALLALWLLQRAGGRPLERLWPLLPRRLTESLEPVAELFVNGLAKSLSLRRMPALLLASLLVAFTMLAPIWLCFLATGLEPTPASCLVVTVFISFAVMIPAAPGHLGTLQWACVVALGIYGVADSPALLFSLVVHVVHWLPVTVFGLAILWARGLRLGDLGRRASEPGLA